MKEQVTINQKTYELVSDYKEDKALRESFFSLAQRSFGIDLKAWYEAGWWGDGYRPYSLLYNGKIIANVSVSIADFRLKGQTKHWVQLGCVAVEGPYRKLGLARFLIEYVMKQYESTSDGIFLFANDRVTEFYPKFGFYKTEEYQYSKKITEERNLVKSRIASLKSIESSRIFRKEEQQEYNYHYRKLDAHHEEDVQLVLEKTKEYYRGENLAVLNNTNLIMFYWQEILADSMYYIEALDTIVIFNEEEGILNIDEVFGEAELDEVVAALLKEETEKVILGFVPKMQGAYDIAPYKAEDTTLFVSSKEMKELFEREKLMFPVLSHT